MLRRLFEDVHDDLANVNVTAEVDGKSIELSARDLFTVRLRAALDVLRIPAFNQLEEALRQRSLENLGYDPLKDSDKLSFSFELFDAMQFFKSIRLCFNEGGTLIDATHMGTGVQNALVVAIFQAYEQLRKRGALFLVEEPEMYLHPHRQRFFYRTLVRIADDNQVIYTTHSPNFVTIPDFENVRIVHRDANDTTCVRASSLAANDVLREKLRKEFDPERNELFFARHVILVEGDTEKLAMPEYAARLDIDLNREGCSIIEVGGKKSMKLFADIVRSFGFSLTVVFDTDSSQFKNEKGKEEQCNDELRSLAKHSVTVVENNPNYESILRQELGEKTYLELCGKYPGVSKAVRARLIAADTAATVPAVARRVLGNFLVSE
jgi:predicted ATP-dependent endonuclease of OLD family